MINDFSSQGLCLINGDNGSGKSSILMALEYLLTDTTSSGISVDELVRRGEKGFELECSVTLSDGREIIISKKRIRDKSKTKLIVDGVDRSFSNKRDTQKEIFNLLGISKESLLYSSIFTQSSPSFVDAPDSGRKEILYEFLGLGRYEGYCQLAKLFAEECDREIRDYSIEISHIRSEINKTREEIETYKAKSEGFEKEKKKELKELKNKLAGLTRIETDEYDVKLKELRKKLSAFDKDEIMTKIDKVEDEIRATKDMIIETELRIEEAEKKLEKVKNNMCPILGRKCEILEEEWKDEVVMAKNEILELENKLTGLKDKEEKLTKKLIRLENEVDKIEQIENKIEEIEDEKYRIEAKNEGSVKLAKLIKNSIRKVKNSHNFYDELIEKKKKVITKLTKDVTEKENSIKHLQEQLQYYNFWIKGFGKQGIPNLEIERILGLIEDKTNEYLSEMTGKMRARIESQSVLKTGASREKISYDIIIGNNRVPVNTLSGGEKQRIKVADTLTFSDILRKFDFLILDEVLDLSLDSKGALDVLQILRKKAEDIGSIYVMSHKTELKGMFDNVIDVGANHV